MDLDTQLVRGGRNAPFIDRSHHMNISGVYSLTTSGDEAGDHNLRVGYGYLYEGAPYFFLAPKDSIRTFWRGGFATPAEIETYDTPFSFENEVTHQWAFINDTWTFGRFSFNGGVRLDSFKPYYEEQGKDGSGPYQDVGDLSGLRVPYAERASCLASLASTTCLARGRTAIKLAYGRYSYNAGTMTNANSMMAGFVNPMARTVKRYRWDGTLPFVPNPANLLSTQGGANRALDPDLELPYTDEFVAGLDQQLMSGTTLRFNYVRKLERNRMKLQNTAIPFAAYNIPVAFTDRGRDFASTADDRVLTLYSLDRAYVGQRADVLMNDPLFTADYADLQRRGRQTSLRQVTGADRLRHQPLRHLGVRSRRSRRTSPPTRARSACRRIRTASPTTTGRTTGTGSTSSSAATSCRGASPRPRRFG